MVSHVDVSSTLFSTVLGQNADKDALPSVLQSLSELKILQISTKSIEDWIGRINNALNSRKTRLEALCLLGLIVDQCSSEVFNQHCISWLRLLLQIFQSHNTVKTLEVACSTTSKILEQVTVFPELSRQVATELIPSIVLCLIKDSDEWLVSALQLLLSCMRYFPGPCGPIKSKLEDKVLPSLRSLDTDIAKAASECYPLLATIGGGGNAGIKHTEAWTHYFDRLLVTAHQILGSLFDGLETENYCLPTAVSINMPDVPDIEPSRTLHLTQHFDVLCACVCNMLQGPFSVVARVPLPEVVRLCCRCFTVQPYMLAGQKSTEYCILLANLYILQRAALDILSSLISSCHGNLISEGRTINQLLVQCLQSTNSETSKISQKPYSVLRTKVYTVLEKWIATVGAAAGIGSNADKLMDYIVQDCSQSQASLYGSSVKVQGFNSQQKFNLFSNSGVCGAALKVLRIMLLSCQLSPAQHKLIHEFTVSKLLQVHQHIEEPPVPYSSQDCRKNLYHVLLAQVLAPHPRWPPSLHCAVQLFRFGRQDPSSLVSSFCIEASITCAALMHPRVHSLQSSLPVVELQESTSLQSRLSMPQNVQENLVLGTSSLSSNVDLQAKHIENESIEGSSESMQMNQNSGDQYKRVRTDEISETDKKRTKVEGQIVVEQEEVIRIDTEEKEKNCIKEVDADDTEIELEWMSRRGSKEISNTEEKSLQSSENMFTEPVSKVLKEIGDQIETQQQKSEDVKEIETGEDEDNDEEEMFTSFVDIPA
ncbi:proline-, glutamic acid- and leucine-rich protein 1-like [Antedon mediterranea]|uniref:proline-, glutamic acid- and leucine-rich protein 1-like n=1 Tax=Antedon mediterranea TaxID=105859 RepID=UPI003AF6A69A